MAKIQGSILAITPLTDRIAEFRIGATQAGTLPDFDAGAHIEIDLPNGETRSYSLISFEANFSSPGHYLVAVQREDDGEGGSKYMHELDVGDTVTFTAPRNDFPVDTSVPAVLLAGGIGITPMISMASALFAANQDVSLIFAGRSEADMAYCAELRKALGDNLHLHFDDKSGVMDLDGVIAKLGQSHLYICGPRKMIDAAREKADIAKIAPERIHFELFEAAKPVGGDVAFEVEINDGTVFEIPPDKTIIEVLVENDVDVMYDCQRGDCGICQCDVLEGVPDHRDAVLSQSERDSGDVMQICVSRAKSSRLVLDI